MIRAAAPALMAGNAMLLKHATNTTRCALEIERLFRRRARRRDVSERLLIPGNETRGGARRCAHRGGDAHRQRGGRHCGGTRRGRGSSRSACSNLADRIRSSCWPMPISRSAAKTAVNARFQNNGESCIAAKRFIVEEPVYEQFLSRFAELAPRSASAIRWTRARSWGRARATICAHRLPRTGPRHRRCRRAFGAAAARCSNGPDSSMKPTVVADVRPGDAGFRRRGFRTGCSRGSRGRSR